MAPGFEEEKIHQMRTTVKKMRALACWTGFPLGNSFDKLYKLAGRIRDTQLLIKRMRQAEEQTLPSFQTWLQNHLVQLEDEWQRLYKKAEVDKQVSRLQKKKLTAKEGSAEKFSKQRNEALIVFRQQHPINDEQIHKGRKSIKEIDFVTRWLNKRRQMPHNIATEETLQKITDEAGQFMDTVSAIKLLDEYLKQENDEEFWRQGFELQAKWTDEKEKEKRQLVERINSHNF